MDKIWELRVPAHVGGDECYFESYLAAVGTKDEALILAREHGYAPEHIAMRQTDNAWGLEPGAFRPAHRLSSQQPSLALRYHEREPSTPSVFGSAALTAE